jgi:hypothetical protein
MAWVWGSHGVRQVTSSHKQWEGCVNPFEQIACSVGCSGLPGGAWINACRRLCYFLCNVVVACGDCEPVLSGVCRWLFVARLALRRSADGV